MMILMILTTFAAILSLAGLMSVAIINIGLDVYNYKLRQDYELMLNNFMHKTGSLGIKAILIQLVLVILYAIQIRL